MTFTWTKKRETAATVSLYVVTDRGPLDLAHPPMKATGQDLVEALQAASEEDRRAVLDRFTQVCAATAAEAVERLERSSQREALAQKRVQEQSAGIERLQNRLNELDQELLRVHGVLGTQPGELLLGAAERAIRRIQSEKDRADHAAAALTTAHNVQRKLHEELHTLKQKVAAVEAEDRDGWPHLRKVLGAIDTELTNDAAERVVKERDQLREKLEQALRSEKLERECRSLNEEEMHHDEMVKVLSKSEAERNEFRTKSLSPVEDKTVGEGCIVQITDEKLILTSRGEHPVSMWAPMMYVVQKLGVYVLENLMQE